MRWQTLTPFVARSDCGQYAVCSNDAEMDLFLADLKIEREIRRRAEDLCTASFKPRNLAFINDMMRAALELVE